jgi:hypothetical protein
VFCDNNEDMNTVAGKGDEYPQFCWNWRWDQGWGCKCTKAQKFGGWTRAQIWVIWRIALLNEAYGFGTTCVICHAVFQFRWLQMGT